MLFLSSRAEDFAFGYLFGIKSEEGDANGNANIYTNQHTVLDFVTTGWCTFLFFFCWCFCADGKLHASKGSVRNKQ